MVSSELRVAGYHECAMAAQVIVVVNSSLAHKGWITITNRLMATVRSPETLPPHCSRSRAQGASSTGRWSVLCLNSPMIRWAIVRCPLPQPCRHVRFTIIVHAHHKTSEERATLMAMRQHMQDAFVVEYAGEK